MQNAVPLAKAEDDYKEKRATVPGRTALGNATNKEISKQEVKVHLHICTYMQGLYIRIYVRTCTCMYVQFLGMWE